MSLQERAKAHRPLMATYPTLHSKLEQVILHMCFSNGCAFSASTALSVPVSSVFPTCVASRVIVYLY
jgi:hypothetical protein